MSHDMIDAVNPNNIGPEWNGKPALRITVLADPAGQAFDVEAGNAPATEAAAAVRTRLDRGEWSVGYVNDEGYGELTGQLLAHGVPWSEPESWPEPGCYLWAADPSDLIGKGVWHPAVTPIAVQDRPGAAVDLSTVDDRFPAEVAGYIDGPVSAWQAKTWARFTQIVTPAPTPQPEPVPPTPVPVPPPSPPHPVPLPTEVTVLLPVLQEGETAEAVKAVQLLTHNPQVDGVFGPVTAGYVRSFQHGHGLVVDGIVGQHTWGSLLGAPQ